MIFYGYCSSFTLLLNDVDYSQYILLAEILEIHSFSLLEFFSLVELGRYSLPYGAIHNVKITTCICNKGIIGLCPLFLGSLQNLRIL